jgi:hypothetical protein
LSFKLAVHAFCATKIGRKTRKYQNNLQDRLLAELKNRMPFVVSAASKGDWQAVSAKLDVVAHHGRIHSNELDWEGVHHKLHLNVDCTANDFNDACFGEAVD